MIKILVADDHAIMREGLKSIIDDVVDIEVTGESSTGRDVLSKVRENEFDVVLLDLSMPDGNGLDILSQLKKERPDLNVLILTTHPEEQYAIRSLRAGAAGYLTKVSAANELITAIRRVAGGRRYISSSLAEELTDFLQDGVNKLPHEKLSKREYQVLCLIANNKDMKEIGDEMCVAVKTVRTYRNRLLSKMNMKNNTELTLYAIENNLVDRGLFRNKG